jgi:DNA mismatch repair protein MutL
VAIRLLTPEVYNQIAAGEVVENPASVVKELVENAIDANAKRVKVSVKQAGRKLITISDDGDGIPAADVELAFLKHSTSKIGSITDLEKLFTLGFRGEALSSIAAVSTTTVLTRTQDEAAATQITVSAGKVVSKTDAARAHGTTITVEDLFANIPARLKFLKQDATEVRHIKQTLLRILLANPGLHCELVVDDAPAFRYVSVKTHFERIVQVYGEDFKDILLEAASEAGPTSVKAWFSRPQVTKNNRTYQFFFVNRRCVDVNFFYPLLNNLYNQLITSGRHPIAFFFVTIDPSEVDVNVHPAKREVRFRNSNAVYDFIHKAVSRVLRSEESVPNGRPISLSSPFNFTKKPGAPAAPSPQEGGKDYKKEVRESLRTFFDRNVPGAPAAGGPGSGVAFNRDAKTVDLSSISEKPNKVFLDLFSPSILILGQVFNTYLLVESENGLFLIDQHAAHERVIYERLKKELNSRKVNSQSLLLPFQVDLNPLEVDTVKKNMQVFQELGYEVEEFGEAVIVVRAVPSFVRRSNDRELFRDLIDLMVNEQNRKVDRAVLMDRMLESMACHSAIKAGDRQTREDMESLIQQIAGLENLLNCPHGRPFIAKLSREDIEKLFSRRF